jgi:hypothetical protein
MDSVAMYHRETQSLVIPLVDSGTLNTLQQALIHITTRKLIHSAIRTAKIDIRQLDISAHTRATANNISRDRIVLCTSSTMDILHDNVRNGQFGGELVACSQVLLTIALSNFNGVIDVVDTHGIVGDVVDASFATAALEVAGEGCGGAWPDFDAGAVAGVGHGDVVDEDIFYNVGFCGVLSERTDTDAVTAVALQVLHENVGGVGLEGDAVVAVVDHRVLDDDVVAAISVPSILEESLISKTFLQSLLAGTLLTVFLAGFLL